MTHELSVPRNWSTTKCKSSLRKIPSHTVTIEIIRRIDSLWEKNVSSPAIPKILFSIDVINFSNSIRKITEIQRRDFVLNSMIVGRCAVWLIPYELFWISKKTRYQNRIVFSQKLIIWTFQWDKNFLELNLFALKK